MSSSSQFGRYATEVYRHEIIAKLEREEAINAPALNEHDKMMAKARKRVLARLRTIEERQQKSKKVAHGDISVVLSRYKAGAMDESYINVYGKKAETFGTP